MFKINFRIDGGIVLFIIFIFLMAVYFKALQQTENYNNINTSQSPNWEEVA